MRLRSIMFVDSWLYVLNNDALYAKTEGLGHCLFAKTKQLFILSHSGSVSKC